MTIADHFQVPSDAECISGYRLVIPHYVTPWLIRTHDIPIWVVQCGERVYSTQF
jgi:hypothetical protein